MDEQAMIRTMKQHLFGKQTNVSMTSCENTQEQITEKRKATKQNQEDLDKLLEQKMSSNIKIGTPSKNSNYENVNHPKHYNNYDIEVIDMMEKIWGINATINFCQMNAFKYRMRMGTKPNNEINEDIKKEQWYLNKAKELKSKLFDKNIDMKMDQ